MVYIPGMNGDELEVAWMDQFHQAMPISQSRYIDYFLSKKERSFRERLALEMDALDQGDKSFITVAEFVDKVLLDGEIFFPVSIQDQLDKLEDPKAAKILVCKFLYAISLSHDRRSNYPDNLPSLAFYGLPNCGKSIL